MLNPKHAIRNMKPLFLLLFIIVIGISSISAETIRLKSGGTVEGKILEKTDKYIKIDFQGVTLTYYNDEIENIQELSLGAVSADNLQDEIYINDEYGFEVRGPKGWFKRIVDPTQGAGREAAIFSKYAQARGEKRFPQLDITVDIASEGLTNVLAFSEFILGKWQKAARHKSTLRVIEAPHEVEINGVKGAKMVFDLVAGDSKAMRNFDYKFMKEGNVVISVMGLDWAPSSDQNVKDFEATVNSLKFRMGLVDWEQLPQKLSPSFTAVNKENYITLKDQIIKRMSGVQSFSCIYLTRSPAESGAKGENISYYAKARVLSPKEFEVFRWTGTGGNKLADMWRVVGDKVYSNMAGMWMDLSEIQYEVPGGKNKPALGEWKSFYSKVNLAQHIEVLNQNTPSGIDISRDGYIILQFKDANVEKGTLTGPKLFSAEIRMWITKADNTIRIVQQKFSQNDEYDWFYFSIDRPFVLGKPQLFYGTTKDDSKKN